MRNVYLFLNVTNKFRSGWKHLDKQRFIARVRITPPRILVDGNGYDDGPVYMQHVRLPRGVDSGVAQQALRETIGGDSCRHEHDCCGCASYHVRTRMLNKRDMLVRTHITYNY